MIKRYFAAGGAVALAAVWPLAVGYVGQTLYEDQAAKNDYGSVFTHTYDYQRGYLSSDVYTTLTFVGQAAETLLEDGFPVEWQVHTKVKHGLLSISTENVIVLTDEQRIQADKVWGEGVEPTHISTTSQLNGDTVFEWVINPITFEDELTETTFNVDTITVRGEGDVEGKGRADFSVPSVTLVSAYDESGSLSNLTGTVDGYNDGNFWLGTQAIHIDGIAYDDGYEMMSADNISFNLDNQLDESGGKLNHVNRWSVGSFKLDDEALVKDTNVTFTLDGLNYDGLTQLVKLFDGLENDDFMIDELDVALALDLLVSKGIDKFGIDAAINFQDNNVTLGSSLAIPEGIARVSENPLAILDVLTGDINVAADKQLVDAHGMMMFAELPAWIKQGIILDSGDQYQSTIKIEENQIVFADGTKVPLFALAMMLL